MSLLQYVVFFLTFLAVSWITWDDLFSEDLDQPGTIPSRIKYPSLKDAHLLPTPSRVVVPEPGVVPPREVTDLDILRETVHRLRMESKKDFILEPRHQRRARSFGVQVCTYMYFLN